MTQSSNLTKLHEAQVKLANETLVNYRDFITKEFIDEFGSSYQTAAQFKDIWRKAFKYAPECEAFLINKSKLFVAMLPTDNKLYKNPKFLKILIRKICEYLSTYTCRIAEKPNIPANQQIINRSKFANNLFAALFENNTYVQNVIKRYEHESNKAYGLRQRQKRKEKAEAKERQRINDKKNAINTVVIKMQPDQEAKIEGKRIRQRIREIHAQIIIIDNQR